MKDHDWFKVWFRAMPVKWQAGMWDVIKKGKIFLGDLPAIPGGNSKPIKVMFLPAHLADMVAETFEAMAKGE